jgi:hypothetical protein
MVKSAHKVESVGATGWHVLSWSDVVARNPVVLEFDTEASGQFVGAGEAEASAHGKAVYLKQQLQDKLIEHKEYIDRYGEDLPEIRHWKWGATNGG